MPCGFMASNWTENVSNERPSGMVGFPEEELIENHMDILEVHDLINMDITPRRSAIHDEPMRIISLILGVRNKMNLIEVNDLVNIDTTPQKGRYSNDESNRIFYLMVEFPSKKQPPMNRSQVDDLVNMDITPRKDSYFHHEVSGIFA
jgi:hypothetical protein